MGRTSVEILEKGDGSRSGVEGQRGGLQEKGADRRSQTRRRLSQRGSCLNQPPTSLRTLHKSQHPFGTQFPLL